MDYSLEKYINRLWIPLTYQDNDIVDAILLFNELDSI
jgi:hypothetical protein